MSNAPKVAVLVGSLRKESFNKRLARALEKMAGDRLAFDVLRLDNLPLYDQDFDGDYPAVCAQFKKDIEAADAVLLITPEYNRSFSGVIKNAIDIASRPWGTNSFAGKPAAVIGVSIGATGTSMAQAHLDNVMLYLDTVLMPQPEVYLKADDELLDMDGNVSNEGTAKFLGGFVDAFVKWIDEKR
ncbi:MAG: NAD(P)H-dependent oxidoreductase [Pseudoxanthomonas suwonensis]|nr:NAD(P)H-dependent oxidoreductase [Pseudoxanthomonas suwonensis]